MDVRTHLVEVAAAQLREHGAAAVTTRAVAQAAGVQAPAIYRLFGDKDGLLDAVAEHAYADYVAGKAPADDSGDPVADLRVAWHLHIAFGLENSALLALIADPRRASRSPALAAGQAVLAQRVARIAAVGRLCVTEARAVHLLHAGGTGAIATLLAQPPDERDAGLADAMFDAVAAVTITATPALPTRDLTAAVVTFRALVPELAGLTAAERALLRQWLDRESRR